KAEALGYLLAALNEINSAGGDFSVLEDNIAELDELLVQTADSPGRYGVLGRARRAVGFAAAMTDITRLEDIIDELEAETIEPWPHRVILGLGIDALSFRTRKGDTVRIVGPGSKITLYVFPIGRQLSFTDVSPNVQRLTVVDDCTTDVASIDSKTVYLPFDELQRLNDMAEQAYRDGRVGPARCSQIQIKVRSDVTSETELQDICDEIDAVWRQFKRDYSESYPNDFPNVLTINADARTWRERQIDLISMIETQRTLMIVMFGIMSLVSVVLVFVLFYMIVVQKTRDIGVLKAIGASSPGVAGIFLAYGAVIGLVGSIIGSISGYIFVRNFNGIRNWLGDEFGFRPWTRERFMFAEIPNQVDPWTVLVIIVVAVIAGVLGAIVPAIRAARMQPVEALRYE
ncbi:MAG: ABC transporter permease, partial [Phycisphaerae bacterium]|nr:ABC transporter permease [Phycisphaerae bacterium]